VTSSGVPSVVTIVNSRSSSAPRSSDITRRARHGDVERGRVQSMATPGQASALIPQWVRTIAPAFSRRQRRQLDARSD